MGGGGGAAGPPVRLLIKLLLWKTTDFPSKATGCPPSSPLGLRTPTAERRRSAPPRHPRHRLAAQTCSLPNQKSICNLCRSFPHRGDGGRVQPNAGLLILGGREHGRGVSYISSAVLQAHDVGVLAQLHHGIQRQLQARVSRDAVENHRDRAAVGHLRVKRR